MDKRIILDIESQILHTLKVEQRNMITDDISVVREREPSIMTVILAFSNVAFICNLNKSIASILWSQMPKLNVFKEH